MSETVIVPVDDDVIETSFCREPVKLRIDGNVETWHLVEFGGVERDSYREFIRAMFETTPEGEVKAKNVSQAGTEQYLLSLTLRRPNGDKVTIDEINALIPGMAQVKLAERATKLNGLGKGAKEEAKKN